LGGAFFSLIHVKTKKDFHNVFAYYGRRQKNRIKVIYILMSWNIFVEKGESTLRGGGEHFKQENVPFFWGTFCIILGAIFILFYLSF
jgi:hypothetical protein